MAAVRVAARRLLGGGQRPAVAVDEAQRRLFPRLFQVDRATRSTSTTSSAAAAAAETNVAAGKGYEDREKLLRKIHNSREELYDMVSDAERIYKIPGRAGREISRLRQELAMQVEPRPGDMTWRLLRGNSKFQRYMGFATFIFSSYVLTGMAIGSIVELEPDEKRWIKKKREEARKRSGDNVSSS